MRRCALPKLSPQTLSGCHFMSPCHLVPSSRVRPLATTAVTLLHLSRSLASHLMQLMEGPVMLFKLSSHLVIGLPRLLFPLISPIITPLSIPRSCLTTCTKYLEADCATLDSSLQSGLIFSNIHTLVFLSIHVTRIQHHISNSSTFFLSVFLIVLVSAPCCTIRNTKSFTSFYFVACFIPLSFHIVVNPPSLRLLDIRSSLPPPRLSHSLSPLHYLW